MPNSVNLFGSGDFSTSVRAKYADLFKLLHRVDSYARNLQNEFSLEADDVQGILVGGYFHRSIENAKAAVILSEQGLLIPGRVVLRAALESLFYLRSCLSYAFCERLVASDIGKRSKMLRKVEQLSKIAKVPGLDEMLASDRISEFRKEVAQVETSGIPIMEIAKAAGCYDLYIGVYATLSASVHSSIYDIERHIDYSDDGHIIGLSKPPDIESVPFVLVSAIEILLNTSLAVCAFLNKDCTDYLGREHATLRKLADMTIVVTEVALP